MQLGTASVLFFFFFVVDRKLAQTLLRWSPGMKNKDQKMGQIWKL